MALLTATPPKDNPDDTRKGDPAPLVPFTRASFERVEPFHAREVQLTTSSQPQQPISVPAVGYLRGILLLVTATGGDGTSVNAVAHADAPWSVLDNVVLTDTDGTPIYGPLSGFEAYLAEKWGAYSHITDPKLMPEFSAVDSDGDFSFALYIPVEITARSAVGSLINQNSAQPYQLSYTIAADSAVYDTSPDDGAGGGLPKVKVEAFGMFWLDPADTDAAGRPQETTPPALGTTQMWTRQVTPSLALGQNNILFRRVGNLIRNLVLIHRDASGDRTNTSFGGNVRLQMDGDLLELLPVSLLRRRQAQRFGLTETIDTPGGQDTGVYVFSYTHELDGRAGFEMHDLYLATHQGTRLELEVNLLTAGTITVLTNDVVPRGI